jgi:hypothetical protein
LIRQQSISADDVNISQVNTNGMSPKIEILVELEKLDHIVLIVQQISHLSHIRGIQCPFPERWQELLPLQIINAKHVENLMEIPLLEDR